MSHKEAPGWLQALLPFLPSVSFCPLLTTETHLGGCLLFDGAAVDLKGALSIIVPTAFLTQDQV